MPRYVSRRTAFDDEYYPSPPLFTSIDVYENGPTDTGLLDAQGNPIFRVKDPIGFRD